MLNFAKTKGALCSLAGGFVCPLHVRRIATTLLNTHPRQGFDIMLLLCYGKHRRKELRFRSFSPGEVEEVVVVVVRGGGQRCVCRPSRAHIQYVLVV